MFRMSRYILIGMLLGFVLYKSEAVSWFRIYEMFRFQSFHMYGIIGSAVVAGIIIVQIIKSRHIKNVQGVEISIKDKNRSIPRYLIGGFIFGLGWALAWKSVSRIKTGVYRVILSADLFSVWAGR